MATNPKSMFRGAASTSNTTLYTVPASTTAIVTDIVVANTDTSSATFTINLDGVALIPGTTLAAKSVATFELKQVVETTDIISGSASATTVNFHISGVEVS
jgi:hypothetical protein